MPTNSAHHGPEELQVQDRTLLPVKRPRPVSADPAGLPAHLRSCRQDNKNTVRHTELRVFAAIGGIPFSRFTD